MYFRRKTSAGRSYLQIVASRRDGDQVRQQVIATLGRYEELQASGQLERLLRSGARFAAKAMVLAAAENDAATKVTTRRIGPALVFERLWDETGCRAVIEELAGKRKCDHDDPSDRSAAQSLRHCPGMRGRRARHGQRRDDGRARGAPAAVYSRRARAHRQAGA